MCTAISYKTKDHYFGRNLDLEYSYQESVAVTPRNFKFTFRLEREFAKHYAMIGMAYVKEGYPLYYDATNEKGLSMAGLSFAGNAVYPDEQADKYNVAPYELISWVLGQCKDGREAVALLEKTNVVRLAFSKELPVTPLHFLIADKEACFVVEPMEEGLVISHNPVCVLTNNPPFSYHLNHLNQYMTLTRKVPMNTFSKELPLECYSRGMGGIGLPGDLSSSSRFVRAAFTRWNAVCNDGEEDSVSQCFHILSSVEQQRGCVQLENREYEYTIYSSCCNTDKGIYYYRTYENGELTAVDMYREDLDSSAVIAYPMRRELQVKWEK